MNHGKYNRLKFVGVAIAGLFVLAGSAFAEKSIWQKIADFFSPGESIDCEGPVCDELHALDSRINKVEGKYSRERRPMNKERYGKELDSLNVVRDSLIAIIKSDTSASKTVSSSESAPASSSAVCSHDTVFVRDTVFVHDTVVVHDTLYVMLANKPVEPVAPAASSAAAVNSNN